MLIYKIRKSKIKDNTYTLIVLQGTYIKNFFYSKEGSFNTIKTILLFKGYPEYLGYVEIDISTFNLIKKEFYNE